MANTTPQFIQSVTSTTISSPTTATLTVTQGHMIIVCIIGLPTTMSVSSVTDTLNNTYVSSGGTNTTIFGGYYFTSSSGSGSNTITVNTSGSPTAIIIDVREYSGMWVSDNTPTSTDTQSNKNASSTSVTTSSITTNYQNDLAICYVGNNSSNTYTVANQFGNFDTATQGTLIAGFADAVIVQSAVLVTYTPFTQSSTASWGHAFNFRRSYGYISNTNFQFVKAPNGISVTEKIR